MCVSFTIQCKIITERKIQYFILPFWKGKSWENRRPEQCHIDLNNKKKKKRIRKTRVMHTRLSTTYSTSKANGHWVMSCLLHFQHTKVPEKVPEYGPSAWVSAPMWETSMKSVCESVCVCTRVCYV